MSRRIEESSVFNHSPPPERPLSVPVEVLVVAFILACLAGNAVLWIALIRLALSRGQL